MLNQIKKLLLKRDDGTPADPKPSPAPSGYFAPKEMNQLTSAPLRQTNLQQIWENSSLPADIHQRFYLAPLYLLLDRVQNVPATRLGRWSQADGFGDLTIQFSTYAVRLAKGYMFPPGVAPEEQAAQNVIWNAVIFWSALFYHLPLLAELEGELIDGGRWQPGLTVPESPYRFRFLPEASSGNTAQTLAALMAGQLLPAAAVSWLAGNNNALRNLTGAVWNNHPEMPLIRSLLHQAAEMVESPLIATPETSSLLPEVGSPSAIPLAPISVEPDTGELITMLDSQIPVAETTPQPDALLAGEENINAAAQGSSELAADADLLLELFSPEQERGHGDLSSITESESSLADIPAAVLAPEETEGHDECVSPPEATEQTGNPDAKKPCSASPGEEFMSWLSAGLTAGTISINQKSARVHAVAGFIFLCVPDIFFLFISEAKKEYDRDTVQSSFEKLKRHRICGGERFFRAKLYASPEKDGRFTCCNGYLVRTARIFKGGVSPEDSRLLLFS